MKKNLLIGIFLLGSTVFAGQFNVPEAVEKELNRSARSMSGSERNQYINWQKRAYLKIDKIGAESGIPSEEFERIKIRLHKMYGSNYTKQLQVVDEEIEDYKELVKRVSAGVQPDKLTNDSAKQKLDDSIKTSALPQGVLDIYLESARKLYPDNYVAQQKYMDSVTETFPQIIHWIKNNRDILN